MDISVIEINLVEPITSTRLLPSDGRGALIGIIDIGKTHARFHTIDHRGGTHTVDRCGISSVVLSSGIRELDVHGIERPSGETGPERVSLANVHAGKPGCHCYTPAVLLGDVLVSTA